MKLFDEIFILIGSFVVGFEFARDTGYELIFPIATGILIIVYTVLLNYNLKHKSDKK